MAPLTVNLVSFVAHLEIARLEAVGLDCLVRLELDPRVTETERLPMVLGLQNHKLELESNHFHRLE